ncbi:MAG: hypothetical protein NTY01_11165 [Verrucomicrobia bacterium]|nr:hypothetical protein [Verrucomicrobiota bacterium]
MRRTAAVMLVLCVVSLVARAEMPETIVTPENAGKQEVRFSVNIVAEPEHNYARVTLKVSLVSLHDIRRR